MSGSKQAQIEAHKARVARRKAREERLAMVSRVARTANGKRDRFYRLDVNNGLDIDAQERQEADEDRAYVLLESTGNLDDCIAHGLIAEDEQGTLSITEAGWALTKSLGWEASE